jgi:hypothetical protein
MVHTAPATPFVLHLTLIGRGAMKKFGIDSHWRDENFCIVIFHFSIGNTKMNDPRLCKSRKECLNGVAD